MYGAKALFMTDRAEEYRPIIDAQFADLSEAQVAQELRRRLAIAREINSAGIYRDVETSDE